MHHRADDNPQARARHVLKTQLATIWGWAQLLARENKKSDPDQARLAELTARLEADIARMSAAIDGELGLREAPSPGEGNGHPPS